MKRTQSNLQGHGPEHEEERTGSRGQNQSICSGTFPSSTPSLMLIELVSSPLQWVNPPCPQEEKVPAKAPSLADPQQVLTYSPTWGLLLRFAPMGTPSNTYFTPGGSPTAPLSKALRDTPEAFQDACTRHQNLFPRSQSPETTKQVLEYTATSPETLNNLQCPAKAPTLQEPLATEKLVNGPEEAPTL